MKNFAINWKTTAAGAGSICTGLGLILHAIAGKTVDMTQVSAGIAAIMAGAGLIFAKDGNVTGGTKPQ